MDWPNAWIPFRATNVAAEIATTSLWTRTASRLASQNATWSIAMSPQGSVRLQMVSLLITTCSGGGIVERVSKQLSDIRLHTMLALCCDSFIKFFDFFNVFLMYRYEFHWGDIDDPHWLNPLCWARLHSLSMEDQAGDAGWGEVYIEAIYASSRRGRTGCIRRSKVIKWSLIANSCCSFHVLSRSSLVYLV